MAKGTKYEPFPKDPDAVLDYYITWSSYFPDDALDSSEWTADDGITIESDTFDDSTATVVLSGGTANTKYKVTNHVTTASGKADDRSFYVKVEER